MSDQAFIINARKSWKRVVDSQDKLDGHSLAVATALWATMNVDKLLEIAERANLTKGEKA